jgi:serine/threonine protein kinase
MAPEQFSHQVSAQSDIYALGITAYEMLSGGRLPFHGDTSSPGSTTRAKYEWEHRNRELPPLGQFNPSLSPAVIEAVNKALHKDPRRRYASALAFWKAVHGASGAGKDARSPSGNGEMTIYSPGLPPKGTPPGPRQPTPSPNLPQPPPHAALRLGAPHLYVRSGEMAGQSFAIPKQGLKIGRHRECQIHLQDRSVSREHATVFITKQGGFVRDENSMLGTFLNDRRRPAAAPVPLNDGDAIRIGLYQTFQFFLK